MKDLRRHLENEIATCNQLMTRISVPKETMVKLMSLKRELKALVTLERYKEAYLIYFTEDKDFYLCDIEITKNGTEHIRFYEKSFSLEDYLKNYYEAFETSKCRDITDTFKLSDYATKLYVTDNLLDCVIVPGVYYLVGYDEFYDFVVRKRIKSKE